MATNAEGQEVDDDDKEVTEDDLRKLKEDSEVENSKEADESQDNDGTDNDSEEAGEDDGQTDDQAEDEGSEDDSNDDSDEETSDFVKKFPHIKGDTPEEYAKNLEAAYDNSTAEFQRLRDSQAKPDEGTGEQAKGTEVDLSNPVELYAKQKMDEEMRTAYDAFSKQYPQVNDPVEFNKFTNEVATLSATIISSQKRLASAEELYSKAAVILGWTNQASVDSKDKLGMALKNSAASSKTASSTKKTPKSKVTDQMVALNMKMYPGKTADEIRKELEEFVTI